jgi:hypothetical protein
MNSNFKSKFFFALVVSSLIAAPVFAKHGGDDGAGSSSSSSGGTSSSSSAGSSSSSGGMSSSSSAGSSSSSGGMSSSSSSNNNGGNKNQVTRDKIRFKGNMTLVAAAEDLATSKASFKLEHKAETKKNKTKSETELEMKLRFPVEVPSLALNRETAPAKVFKAELMGDTDGDNVLNLIATCELDYHQSTSLYKIEYRLKAETKSNNGSLKERQKVGNCDTLVDIQKATSVVVFHENEVPTRTDLFQITK